MTMPTMSMVLLLRFFEHANDWRDVKDEGST
jgi:hypothetical protein